MKLVYYESCTVSKETIEGLVSGPIGHRDSRFWESSGVEFKNEKEQAEQGITGIAVVDGSRFQEMIVSAFAARNIKVEVLSLPSDHRPMTGKVATIKTGEAPKGLATADRVAAVEAQSSEKVAALEARIAELEAAPAVAPDLGQPSG